jgi:HSP20 family protein
MNSAILSLAEWVEIAAEGHMSDHENSLRELRTMQERMNALLEESLRGAVARGEEFAESTWAPAADAFETEREIVLLVDVPGVDRADLHVDVDGRSLVVRGERRVPEHVADVETRRVERAYGAFSRAFDLPPTVDETRIRAEHRDGVLSVRLPKRESPRGAAFRIEVE